MSEESNKVSIACQGGDSHTAFSAGFLQCLLKDWEENRHKLVGISGTSGGAFNALATWYGLVTQGPNLSVKLLEKIWNDLKATSFSDKILNDFVVNTSHIESTGIPIPRVSPYNFPSELLGKKRIKNILTKHINFDSIPDLCDFDSPELIVGTVNVNAGEFETFKNKNVTPKAVLASAAVPNLFEGVKINGHLHWDGLFSQNPPISDLMEVEYDRKPDKLWIIQINSQEFEGTPTSLEEIADRRNDLSGNISLNQEIRFIKKVNEWIERGDLSDREYSKTDVKRIEIGKHYDFSTKLDRSPKFIEELLELGKKRGKEFKKQNNLN